MQDAFDGQMSLQIVVSFDYLFLGFGLEVQVDRQHCQYLVELDFVNDVVVDAFQLHLEYVSHF